MKKGFPTDDGYMGFVEGRYICTRVWGIGIPIKRLTRRYAVAIKWRYGNTWVDLALIYKPSYIYKRWRGKIQGVRERILELDTKTYYFLYQVDFSRHLCIIELGTKTIKKLYEVI